MGLFEKQNTPEQLAEAKIFHEHEQVFLESRNIKKNSRQYLQPDFFQHIVNEYKLLKDSNRKSKDIEWLFGKACDILIRHLLTSTQNIQENDEHKENCYCYAMYRINNYAIRTYDFNKAKAFVYFTSTISNAFKEEFNKSQEQKNIAKNKLKNEGLAGFVTNVDIKDTNSMELEYVRDYNIQESVTVAPFYKDLNKRYSIQNLAILEDENVPRFKRTYQHYNTFIPVNNIINEKLPVEDILSYTIFKEDYSVNNTHIIGDIESSIEDELFIDNIDEINSYNLNIGTINISSDGNLKFVQNTSFKGKSIKIIFHLKDKNYTFLMHIKQFSGLVIEYIDLYQINEDQGYSKHYLQNKMRIAREHGYQYFAVFSDIYNNKDLDDEIYVWSKINNIIACINNQDEMLPENYSYNGLLYYPEVQYIPTEFFTDMKMNEPDWFYLDKKRAKKQMVFSQSVKEYMRLKEEDERSTRIYGYGTIEL